MAHLHGLRHTFVSVLVALGKDLSYIMDQAGQSEPDTTLRIYAKVMRSSEADRERLRVLVEGPDVATSGDKADSGAKSKAAIVGR